MKVVLSSDTVWPSTFQTMVVSSWLESVLESELVSALESELESSAGSLSVSSFTRVTVLSPLVQVTDWMLSSLMLGNSARAMSSSTWISRAVGRVLAMVYTVSLPSTLA